MKTFVHIKSGNRYPEFGCVSWFTTFSTSKGKLEYHIKPGYPECTKGWKRVKMEQWREETIPDLQSDFTREQWLEYAKTYGVICAQQFLRCCDYMKPREANRMFNPPKNEQTWIENAPWFKHVFKMEIWPFMDGMMISFANTYSFDIIHFEKYLVCDFGYKFNSEMSIKDFMIEKFGAEETKKFQELFLK